jgi:hypothetical protein
MPMDRSGNAVAGIPRQVTAVAGMMSAPASMGGPSINNMNKDTAPVQMKPDPRANVMKSLENIVLPSWSGEEIDKRLVESEEFLREWKDLIDRTSMFYFILYFKHRSN